ncbi:probable LRR receptor-like serine/threonine-protein kinase At3g47570 [Alnus glutinosa]|uniref:probable LRR receptor-like serine/threonine-protein kinase At3g47570 n=1 Tax=Alnus glutinosa TaxID=3517 RepID=UPI002D76B2DA|nr:probable LRR receptor-like serine/threonine-protein kinase At3g47570 [Alnus glutinosa]
MERTCFLSSICVALLMVQSYIASLAFATIPNITTDQSALLALKASISHDPHNVLTNNWSTSISVCNWIGITCGFRHHRVTALDLSYMGLVGTIPPHMGNLSFLVSLSVINNSFYGSVPNELARLYRLHHLSLKHNDFNGEIPPWMGQLSKLQFLSLAINNFTGGIPPSLCNISSLEIIGFRNNKLSGSISLFKCKRLQHLDLGYNYFTGSIPSEIGNLTMLTELFLHNNNFTGTIPPHIFNISTIQVIDMSFNILSGHLPTNLGLFLPNFQIFHLWGNQLSGTIPSSISNASQLTILNLGNNSFSGLIPKSLGNLRLLQWLDLEINNLTTEYSTLDFNFFSSLSNLAYLRLLILSNNPLNDILPSSIGNLSTSLQQLYIANCGIKGNIPRHIGNLSNLMTLNLQIIELVGLIPSAVGRLDKLQALFLDYNRLEGPIPSNLCHLESLFELYLDSNELSGSIPVCISNMTSLRVLYLDSNQLTSMIPLSLWRLTFILEVNLSSNSLSGPLPFEIGNLKVLRVLALSRNQLSGNIPTTIGGLKDLANLSLAHNQLEGSIPESFGELLSLEFLDLSNNNLSGEIPKSLESLSYLKYLNISFNRLQGKIPLGGPFVNFSAASFMSNDGLCGAPRLQVAPCKEGVSRPKKTTIAHILKYALPTIGLTILVVVALVLVWMRRQKRNKQILVEANSLPLATWRRISQQELLQATDGFNAGNLLGKGSFGSVYQGKLSDGTIVAIKVFNLAVEGAFKSFDTECEVLRNIRHRNLVKIISMCSNMDFKSFVLEYMPNGNLEKWLYSQDHYLSVLQRLNIMIDVASALEYLHHGYSTPIVHCDLKPSNVLLDEDMVAHVADFGIAKMLGDGESMMQTITLATIGYMAPEYGLEGIVSTRGDVYSYGILLMETFTRKKPTDDMFVGEMSLKHWVEESSPLSVTKVVDAYLLRTERDYAAMENCMSSIMGLALQCCAELHEKRINAKSILITLNKIKLKFLRDTQGRS